MTKTKKTLCKTLLTSLKYWLYVCVCSCVSWIMYHEGADMFWTQPKILKPMSEPFTVHLLSTMKGREKRGVRKMYKCTKEVLLKSD